MPEQQNSCFLPLAESTQSWNCLAYSRLESPPGICVFWGLCCVVGVFHWSGCGFAVQVWSVARKQTRQLIGDFDRGGTCEPHQNIHLPHYCESPPGICVLWGLCCVVGVFHWSGCGFAVQVWSVARKQTRQLIGDFDRMTEKAPCPTCIT
ncbi:hypothetical protein SRHO_G00252090 [Serrasalmus rhombeus]